MHSHAFQTSLFRKNRPYSTNSRCSLYPRHTSGSNYLSPASSFRHFALPCGQQVEGSCTAGKPGHHHLWMGWRGPRNGQGGRSAAGRPRDRVAHGQNRHSGSDAKDRGSEMEPELPLSELGQRGPRKPRSPCPVAALPLCSQFRPPACCGGLSADLF